MPVNEKDDLPDVLRNLREADDGYTPPGEDYFSALAERSMAAAGQAAVSRTLPVRRWAVAVAILLLLSLVWFVTDTGLLTGDAAIAKNEQPSSEQPSSEELLADLDPEVIDEYISEQIDDFTLELYDEAPLNE